MTTPSSQTEPAPLTVYYDGACPVCRREIGFARRRGADMDFVDIARGGVLPEGLDRNDALARFHVRRPDGTVLAGAEAFGEMWARIPLLRPLGWIARRKALQGPLDWLYGRFLKVRPLIQKGFGGRDDGA